MPGRTKNITGQASFLGLLADSLRRKKWHSKYWQPVGIQPKSYLKTQRRTNIRLCGEKVIKKSFQVITTYEACLWNFSGCLIIISHCMNLQFIPFELNVKLQVLTLTLVLHYQIHPKWKRPQICKALIISKSNLNLDWKAINITASLKLKPKGFWSWYQEY